jgi:hypothetical protein
MTYWPSNAFFSRIVPETGFGIDAGKRYDSDPDGLYLDVAYERWKRENRMNSLADLEASVMVGAVQRAPPCLSGCIQCAQVAT